MNSQAGAAFAPVRWNGGLGGWLKRRKNSAMEYKLRHENDEVVPCDSCGCEAPTGKFDWGPPYTEKHDSPHRMICEFCSTTMTSRYTERPNSDQYTALRAEIWKAAACVFNMLKTPNAAVSGRREAGDESAAGIPSA